jgi:uncharacterized protein (TIGR00255 family)
MTLVSMTGFTRSSGALAHYRWVWEIKTVNGKGLDIRLRLPSGFDELDQKVRAAMSKRLARGSCYVTLTVQHDETAQSLKINDAVLEDVLAAVEMLSKRLDVKKPSIDGILSIRGVMEAVDEKEDDALRQDLVAAMLADFDAALTDLVKMRAREGAALEIVLLQRVDELEHLARKAEESPARSVEAIQAKLKQQIERILDVEASLDADRLYQEAVLLAGKADIREELDRLFAHCAAARDLIAESKPVGRKLDFLAQEFNREANTLCSKSNDTSLTSIGLELKATIEQLREQIQNVE